MTADLSSTLLYKPLVLLQKEILWVTEILHNISLNGEKG